MDWNKERVFNFIFIENLGILFDNKILILYLNIKYSFFNKKVVIFIL